MPVRPVLQIGHPSLKKENDRVDLSSSLDKVNTVITDLVDTMREHNLVGIAAPQIGENIQLFVTEVRPTDARSSDFTDELRVYINPEFIYLGEEEVTIYEGCGCVMNGLLFGPVDRPREVTVKAYDREGTQFQLTCDGLLGRVIQHEYDHLVGVEFTEKVADYRKLMHRDFYVANVKNSPKQEEASRVSVVRCESLS